MRRPRRWRWWVAVLAGAALTTVSIGAWAVSLYGYAGWQTAGGRWSAVIEVADGAAWVGLRQSRSKPDPTSTAGWNFDRGGSNLNFEGTRLWFSREQIIVSTPSTVTAVPAYGIPLWLPSVVFAVLTVVLARRIRRFPPTCCSSCGYDLTGFAAGTVPGVWGGGDGGGSRKRRRNLKFEI